MKLLAWNVWGMSSTQAVRALQRLVREVWPSVVFLSETKGGTRMMESVWIKLGFASNMGYLLLIIVPAVCEVSNGLFGDSSVCSAYGMTYASVYMAECGPFSDDYPNQAEVPPTTSDSADSFPDKVIHCFKIIVTKLNLKKVFVPATIAAGCSILWSVYTDDEAGLLALSGAEWRVWDRIKEAMQFDARTVEIRKKLEDHEGGVERFSYKNGILYYKNYVYVPGVPGLREEILAHFHNSKEEGHSGWLRTYLNIMDGPRRAGQRVAARGARDGRTGRGVGAGKGAGVGKQNEAANFQNFVQATTIAIQGGN
ncbi:hypothetical protein LWI28_017018 [Acer negundo]|uniref:Uncharacterized protein n=1 Tax=Acer negundo TaxID=4023 RepID=A0AAD5IFL3_ACENE|nr:hypothetical protein LWI28_017018 [Acer negundo]